MPKLKFYKYQGAGNDFVILDNRNNHVSLTEIQINRICDRRFGVGADGLMLLNPSKEYDFDMVYHNSDGKESTMCGNGGRCLVKFAYDINAINTSCSFMAVDGEHTAKILSNGQVKLKMSNTSLPSRIDNHLFLDTGSPHVVVRLDDMDELNIIDAAREIRYKGSFKQEGTNVNFIQVKDNKIEIRTYERGVEDETLACGTGVTAAALVSFEQGWINTKDVDVKALGGDLSVSFDKQKDGFIDVYLTGPAEFVFNGEISI